MTPQAFILAAAVLTMALSIAITSAMRHTYRRQGMERVRRAYKRSMLSQIYTEIWLRGEGEVLPAEIEED